MPVCGDAQRCVCQDSWIIFLNQNSYSYCTNIDILFDDAGTVWRFAFAPHFEGTAHNRHLAACSVLSRYTYDVHPLAAGSQPPPSIERFALVDAHTVVLCMTRAAGGAIVVVRARLGVDGLDRNGTVERVECAAWDRIDGEAETGANGQLQQAQQSQAPSLPPPTSMLSNMFSKIKLVAGWAVKSYVERRECKHNASVT